MGKEENANYGYHYYPTIKDYTQFFVCLEALENKFCQE
jgi:hypothetical protein